MSSKKVLQLWRYLPVKKLYRFCMCGLSLKYDFERQLHTRSATSIMNSLVAGFLSLFTFKSFWIKAWNLPLRASKVSLSKLGRLSADPLQVSAVSKNPRITDNLAKFGSAFPSSVLKTSTTDAMSFKGKVESTSILGVKRPGPVATPWLDKRIYRNLFGILRPRCVKKD